MTFRKPKTWDRETALRVAQSNGGRVVIDWRWRMDQRRGVCLRARRDGLMRKITFQIAVHEDGRKERFKMPPGADVFEITDEGRQWLVRNGRPANPAAGEVMEIPPGNS